MHGSENVKSNPGVHKLSKTLEAILKFMVQEEASLILRTNKHYTPQYNI
jgi:hypothetical protein